MENKPVFRNKSQLRDLDSRLTIAAVFLWSSAMFPPTSLSTCRPSLRKKNVGVALISHEVLSSCIQSDSTFHLSNMFCD